VESVPVEISEREKILSSTLYSEIIKNIESLKINLIIQTPIFEVLDKPSFPIKNQKPIILYYLFNGLLIGVILIGALFLYPFIKQNKI
jgi:capsule polysaccharide export protein KpsE/RkpR